MNRNLVPMTQLIERISMGPFGSDIKTECFVNAGVPVLNGGNLTTIRMNDDSFNFVTKEKANSLSNSIARRGDIVVTHRETLGQLSYIPEDSQYEEYLISQSQFCVTLNTDLVDPIYFAYYFHSPEGQKRLLSFANYVGVPALASATTNFKNLEFPLIPLGEQKEIVNKILCIENKIRNNTSICSDLESMAKLLYDYWFMQFDFPDENGRPYKSSGGKMVWNDELKREIPEGWKVTKFGDVVSMGNGINYSKDVIGDKVYKIVNVRNITGSSLVMNEYDFDEISLPKRQAEKYIVNDNSILIARSGTPGAVRLIYGSPIDIVYCGFIINALPYSNVFRLYYAYALKQYEGTNATKTGGSILQNVSQETLAGVSLCLPNENIVKLFNEQVNNILEKIHAVIDENQELASLRDFLLPMLMNGQIKIEDVKAS